jgi:transcriptional regulator with XRE-family HTH domain
VNILFGKNLEFLRTQKGLKQEELGKQFEVGRSTVTTWETGKSFPDFKKLLEIVAFFNVKLDDIVYGDLTQKKQISAIIQVKEPAPQYSLAPAVITLDEQGVENTLWVDVKAAAGYPQHFTEPTYYKKLPTSRMPGADFRSGTFRWFQVEGDSMEDTIKESDWLLTRFVEGFNQIIDGYIYVVVTPAEVAVKRVLNRSSERGKLVLKSDNLIYPNREVEASDVRELWLVKRKMTGDLSATRIEFLKKMNIIEADMLELRDRIKKLESK